MCANGTTGDQAMDGVLAKHGVAMGAGWPPPAGVALVDVQGNPVVPGKEHAEEGGRMEVKQTSSSRLSFGEGLTRQEAEERVFELRRRLAEGETLGDEAGSVLTDEEVRQQGAHPVDTDKQIALDRLASMYSKVHLSFFPCKRGNAHRLRLEFTFCLFQILLYKLIGLSIISRLLTGLRRTRRQTRRGGRLSKSRKDGEWERPWHQF